MADLLAEMVADVAGIGALVDADAVQGWGWFWRSVHRMGFTALAFIAAVASEALSGITSVLFRTCTQGIQRGAALG